MISVDAMKPITRPGMYARKTGITHAMTGPIASLSSFRQGSDTQTLKATQEAVRPKAIAKSTVGRSPAPGLGRDANKPTGVAGVAERCGTELSPVQVDERLSVRRRKLPRLTQKGRVVTHK